MDYLLQTGPIRDEDWPGQIAETPDTGIPKGSPAAPILFITYLSGIFDEARGPRVGWMHMPFARPVLGTGLSDEYFNLLAIFVEHRRIGNLAATACGKVMGVPVVVGVLAAAGSFPFKTDSARV